MSSHPPLIDKPGGFGIYIHWPFCAAKCPYCDFNSHAARHVDEEEWRKAYLRALETAASEMVGRTVETVFFGGGTPSLMAPATVSAILEKIARHWKLASDIEVTLEANPSSVEAKRFAAYRSAGVNRISIGVQALNDTDLRRLGRLHDVAEARAAIDIAAATFERYSFDLIYARQHQTLTAWEAELREALTLAGGHLSLYQLTIEPGTAFGRRARAGRLEGLPGEDAAARMYLLTRELCDAAGLPAYEISNHAARGQESRHNMLYWQLGDYLGIGPGAHGRLHVDNRRFATEEIRQPEKWLSRVRQAGSGEAIRQPIEPKDSALEYLLMGLRTRQGVSLARLETLDPGLLDRKRLSELTGQGLLEIGSGRLRATRQGWLVLDRLLVEILA